MCTAVIRFQTTEEAAFNIDSSIFYAHTPGDEFTVDWNVRLFNLTTSNTLFNRFFDGGFGQSEPASGTFHLNETHVLPANSLFQFSYTLDSTNIGDFLPTGIMDVGGHVNWNVVPEPATLLLFAAALPLLRRLHR
ncbi:MAG: hypothetical protein IPK83_12060 [Planctomycetes bacterium]|nr:hypothetical protein [Planctomycetota bacterium]